MLPKCATVGPENRFDVVDWITGLTWMSEILGGEWEEEEREDREDDMILIFWLQRVGSEVNCE